MLTALGTALAASSVAIRAQTEKKASASTSIAEAAPAADPSPGTIEETSAAQRTVGGGAIESFKVTSRGSTSVVTVRQAAGNSGDAIITIDGQEIRISSKSQFDIRKPVTASTAKGSSNFWTCMIASMVKQIGQAAWDKIKNNYQSMWNSTVGKPFWARVASFLKSALTLPYASYALIALKACK